MPVTCHDTFTPGKFVKDVSIALEKNKDYWKDGLPYIDGMVHYSIKDKGTAIAAYKTGRVLTSNWAVNNLSSKELEQLQKEAGDQLRIEYIKNSGVAFFYMNTSAAPFDSPKVRQAVNLAIDRQPGSVTSRAVCNASRGLNLLIMRSA